MLKLRRSTHIYCTKCGTSAETYKKPKCWRCGNTKFDSMNLSQIVNLIPN